MLTPFEKIVNVDHICTGKFSHPGDAIRLALNDGTSPFVATGRDRNLLMIIDPNNDFVLPPADKVVAGQPYGSLSVPGARDDMERLLRFIYASIGYLEDILVSVDTHYAWQIFNATMWRTHDGKPVADYTLITTEMIGRGDVYFMGDDLNLAKECVRVLEAAGKGGVMVWPAHTIEGSFGWLIEAQLMQMLTFWSTITGVRPFFTYKGQKPYSEMFGILEPEFNPDEEINEEVDDYLVWYNCVIDEYEFYWDRVIVAGWAGSHCLLETLRQMVNRYPDYADRIYVLTDCTSAVAGFEQQMHDGFAELAERGVHFVTTQDEIF